jgi:hypothetical protein
LPKVKKRAYENLSTENIQKVIKLLDQEKPITKKEACQILSISYNTTRLNKIIVEFQERETYVAKRKATNKGKRAAGYEITEAITNYLQGESISEIATGLYRSSGFVRSILDRVGVPQRPASAEERAGPCILPENCVAESFNSGEKVWSARYHAPAIVDQEIEVNNKYESNGYRVYILEKTEGAVGGFYAYVLACELGKLSHLEEYGVNLNKI